MACFGDALCQDFTSKKVDHIFRKSKLLIKTFSNYEIIRRAQENCGGNL